LSLKNTLLNLLGKVNPRFLAAAEKGLKSIPGVSQKIEGEYAEVMVELERSVKPYRDKFDPFVKIPETGRSHADILRDMEAMRDLEESHWKEGFISGAVYHGDQEHIDFLNRVYAINSQSNPLHADIWPSASWQICVRRWRMSRRTPKIRARWHLSMAWRRRFPCAAWSVTCLRDTWM
jgi:sphinganine-1-phosphate aldolase